MREVLLYPNSVSENIKTYKVAISEEEMYGVIFSDYVAVYKDGEEIPVNENTINGLHFR